MALAADRHPALRRATLGATLALALAAGLVPGEAGARSRYGCGPGNLTMVPQRLGRASFFGACVRHDICYASKWPGGRPYGQWWCDERFHKGLRLACAAAGEGWRCRVAAYSYYRAVRRWGLFSYLSAQRHAGVRVLVW